MFKKICTIALILSFCLTSLRAFALGTGDTYFPPETMEGYLTSDTGETLSVVGSLVDTFSIPSDEDIDVKCATYEYSLYSSDASYDLTVSDTDGAMAVRAYLTIYYTTRPYGGIEEYLLTKISGHWTIIDSSVSVTGSRIDYACTDSNYTSQWVNNKSVSNNFSVNTGFSGYIIELFGLMGATLKLDLKMGASRTWQFSLVNKRIGDFGEQ